MMFERCAREHLTRAAASARFRTLDETVALPIRLTTGWSRGDASADGAQGSSVVLVMGKVDFMDTIYGIDVPFDKSLLKGFAGAVGHGGGEFSNRGRMWRTSDV